MHQLIIFILNLIQLINQPLNIRIITIHILLHLILVVQGLGSLAQHLDLVLHLIDLFEVDLVVLGLLR